MKEKDLDPRLLKIAAGIKKLRKDAGYTSYETFAFENELPRQHYWQIEKGSNITMNTLFKVLDIHKKKLSDFMTEVGL